MDLRAISQSIMLFVVAGLMEIGGGYLVWLWLRESRGWLLGAMGGLLLFLYGVVPTLQPAHFGRVYAAYGGVFVVLSILWGWWVDGVRPDRPEIVGALLFAPRSRGRRVGDRETPGRARCGPHRTRTPVRGAAGWLGAILQEARDTGVSRIPGRMTAAGRAK